MIITQDLGKHFDGFWAVDGVDLRVGEGQVLALLGPNGAGKTTTVRLLTSVLKPSRGWARVAGYDVASQSDQVRSAVGILTEGHGLYGRMSADEYLDFFGQAYGLDRERRRRRTMQLLADFDLIEHRRRRINEYSKGMRQKLALARALLHDPPVLLLDEPSSAMDPESASQVRQSIRALRSASRTIVICTHNLAEAEALADQIAIVQRGRIVARGTPEELKARLLGAAEFEVRFSRNLDGNRPRLPEGALLTGQGQDWLRYRTDDPAHLNPLLLRGLLEQDLSVVGLSEVPRSLELVYLQAIHTSQPKGGGNG